MVYLSNILDRDNRNTFACIRYILSRCCKKNKPLDFMQLKWMIDRCNFLAAKWYGAKFFDYDLLILLEDNVLIPESFNCDWRTDYITDERGYFKRDVDGSPLSSTRTWVESDFISQADIKIMKRIIFHWKLYGKYLVMLDNWWYYYTYRYRNRSK